MDLNKIKDTDLKVLNDYLIKLQKDKESLERELKNLSNIPDAYSSILDKDLLNEAINERKEKLFKINNEIEGLNNKLSNNNEIIKKVGLSIEDKDINNIRTIMKKAPQRICSLNKTLLKKAKDKIKAIPNKNVIKIDEQEKAIENAIEDLVNDENYLDISSNTQKKLYPEEKVIQESMDSTEFKKF